MHKLKFYSEERNWTWCGRVLDQHARVADRLAETTCAACIREYQHGRELLGKPLGLYPFPMNGWEGDE